MSTEFNQLPDKAQEICEQQGWDDQSLIGLLLKFIWMNVPDADAKLTEHMIGLAHDENNDWPGVYNHACYLGFEVRSLNGEGNDITREMLLEALEKRVASLRDQTSQEWREACLPPSDTFWEGPGPEPDNIEED